MVQFVLLGEEHLTGSSGGVQQTAKKKKKRMFDLRICLKNTLLENKLGMSWSIVVFGYCIWNVNYAHLLYILVVEWLDLFFFFFLVELDGKWLEIDSL